MSEKIKYGIAEEGFRIKRLDEILEDMHEKLTANLGFNTRQNPESWLGVLLTNQADKFAELWEAAQESYLAKYPSSAEGLSLDHAAQFGGSTREGDVPSYYPIACTGDDGTILLKKGTRLSTTTVPAVHLVLPKDLPENRISLEACTRFVVYTPGEYKEITSYSITINGEKFFVESADDQTEALRLLKRAINKAIKPPKFEDGEIKAYLSYDEDDDLDTDKDGEPWIADPLDPERKLRLWPRTAWIDKSGYLVVDSWRYDKNVFSAELSKETLTTKEVTSIVWFATEDYGEIVLPDSVVTKTAGDMKAVDNRSPFIAGRVREADDEFRQHYADKIFIRSRTMLESINSAVLNVQGVRSCKTRQNDTHEYVGNMPPHSVEAVVDGDFKPPEVAVAILSSKAAGIQSCHCCGLRREKYSEEQYGFCNDEYVDFFEGNNLDVEEYAFEVPVPDETGNLIKVRFTRPIPCTCNISVMVLPSSEPMAVNCFDLIRETIKAEMKKIQPGGDVRPQLWHEALFKKVSGVAHYDIKISTDDHTDVEYIVGLEYNRRPVCGSVVIDWEV